MGFKRLNIKMKVERKKWKHQTKVTVTRNYACNSNNIMLAVGAETNHLDLVQATVLDFNNNEILSGNQDRFKKKLNKQLQEEQK